jgi:DNA-binding transcriptional MocR family regulator
MRKRRRLRAARAGNSPRVNNAMSTFLVEPSVSVSLQAVTKAEAVYIETRSRILKGTLAPGSAVNQEALAADLGVSITPLREALRRLEMEGLIRLEAHRTMSITPLTSRELDEMYAGNYRPTGSPESGHRPGASARTQSRISPRCLLIVWKQRAD